VVQLGEHESR